ncbi:MAG: transcription antitermination factor NusB [Ruminococcaceae bacterium]|nr:transcription antitermination factor NusB [Oscillospiraceae bacterium]
MRHKRRGRTAPPFIIYTKIMQIFIFILTFACEVDIIIIQNYICCHIWQLKGTCNMNRHDAREAVFELLFETEFRTDENREEIFAASAENRELPEDRYIRDTYFGVCEHLEEIDALINMHSKGWKTTRLAKVTRSILRLAVYEMLYLRGEIPESVSLNEAVELCKKFDDEKAKAFLNGVLNSIKNEIVGAENG